MVTSTPEPRPVNLSFVPTEEDWTLVLALRRKLGVGHSSLFRLALRALAEKERVAA